MVCFHCICGSCLQSSPYLCPRLRRSTLPRSFRKSRDRWFIWRHLNDVNQVLQQVKKAAVLSQGGKWTFVCPKSIKQLAIVAPMKDITWKMERSEDLDWPDCEYPYRGLEVFFEICQHRPNLGQGLCEASEALHSSDKEDMILSGPRSEIIHGGSEASQSAQPPVLSSHDYHS